MNNIKNKIRSFLIEQYINQDNVLSDMSQEDINEILRGYIECALWTEEERLTDESTSDFDDEDYEDMDEIEKIIKLKGKLETKNFTSFIAEDIDDDSKISAYIDIKNFIKEAGDVAIKETIEENDLFQLGMDIWLSRNGHGSGFFDRGYENEETLYKAIKILKPKDLEIGDDGKLHFL